jgi:hypothetical protein
MKIHNLKEEENQETFHQRNGNTSQQWRGRRKKDLETRVLVYKEEEFL